MQFAFGFEMLEPRKTFLLNHLLFFYEFDSSNVTLKLGGNFLLPLNQCKIYNDLKCN